MWRRCQFVREIRGSRRPELIRRLMVLSAALGFCIGIPGLWSQDTAPPPPPDAQASSAEQSSIRTVRLSDVEGQVQVFQGDQLAFSQAQPNMPAVEGMRFVTGDNGRLEIEFEDGSVARVVPNSSIRLTRLERNPDGPTLTQIDALTGLSYYELNGRGGQVSVHFGPDAAIPQDDAVFRVSLDAVPNELAVMHGSVHVTDGQNVSVDIHPSQTFQDDPEQPGQFNVAQSVAADSWDQWNSDRDEALAQLQASETTARASAGDPDDAAWNDLDYYGSWYNLPGYGQVWAPNGVDASWDPFGAGYWGYYPAFGYTWISGYPWGWWPYHCGAWDFASGWGWLWIPGNCGWGYYGAGWFPWATVWSVPPGYRPPLRPHHGPGMGPRPQPLIAVNRGGRFAAPFHFDHGVRPAPRSLIFGGRTIAPLEADIHPLQRGPVGESFTATLVRTHPEILPRVPRTQISSGIKTPYRPAPAAGIRTYTPPRGYTLPRYGMRSSPRSTYSVPNRPAYSVGAVPHPAGGAPRPAPHPSGGTPPHP